MVTDFLGNGLLSRLKVQVKVSMTCLHQAASYRRISERFGTVNAKLAPALMPDSIDNQSDGAVSGKTGQENDRGFSYMIPVLSILYVSTHTGPDIIFARNGPSLFIKSTYELNDALQSVG